MMQKSIFFCCFAAIILSIDAAPNSLSNEKSNSNSNNNNNDNNDQPDEIEQRIRNYVNQVRAREQLEMMKAMRQKQILAAIDPREYYDQVPAAAQNSESQIPSSESDAPQSADKRAQSFVRFGKRAQTFVRFGKRAQTFVRFG